MTSETKRAGVVWQSGLVFRGGEAGGPDVVTFSSGSGSAGAMDSVTDMGSVLSQSGR